MSFLLIKKLVQNQKKKLLKCRHFDENHKCWHQGVGNTRQETTAKVNTRKKKQRIKKNYIDENRG